LAQEDIMRHTFKASFERQSDAEHLVKELLAAGYTGAELALSGAIHSGPNTRQRHAVTLVVDGEPEASHAANIIEHANPARFQSIGDDEPVDYSSAPPTYPPGTEPGALQFRRLENGHFFGTQDAESAPAGTTFQETMGRASLWQDADGYATQPGAMALWPDMDTGDNDDERAAYRFGKAMRMDDRYRNRSWDEAEPSLKHEWDASTNGFAWENVKSSVHNGWDWTTPDIDDDSYYRSHWTTSYANHTGVRGGDDATPIYMDNSEARRSERYRSHEGCEAGDALSADRSTRDARHRSAWDRFEQAVYHGWSRLGATAPDASAGHPIAADGTAESKEGPARLQAGSGVSPWHMVKEAVRHRWGRARS